MIRDILGHLEMNDDDIIITIERLAFNLFIHTEGAYYTDMQITKNYHSL